MRSFLQLWTLRQGNRWTGERVTKSTIAGDEVGLVYGDTEEQVDMQTGERVLENAERMVGRQFEEGWAACWHGATDTGKPGDGETGEHGSSEKSCFSADARLLGNMGTGMQGSRETWCPVGQRS